MMMMMMMDEFEISFSVCGVQGLQWHVTVYTKGKDNCIAVHGTPSHSYGVSLAICDHTVLPATVLPDTSEHTPPSPQPVRPVLDLPTPEGRKAELT